MSPIEADEILAKALLDDAVRHEKGEFNEIGMQYDQVESELLPIQDLTVRRFVIARNFWNTWVDVAQHDWSFCPGISQADWPDLARHIAERLKKGEDATDERIVCLFAPENNPSFVDRLRVWIGKLTGGGRTEKRN